MPRRPSFAALLALLALAGATAAPANGAEPLPTPLGFKVEASNGYSIFVFGAEAREGRPATVGIVANRGRSSAIYFAPATVTDGSIEADLGALGEIAVTFRPSGRARSVRSSCGDEPVSFDAGHYEGTIDFHGEEGYTAVETERGVGDIKFMLDLVCPGISGADGQGPFLPGAQLDVKVNGPGSERHLTVIKNSPGARARFEVSVSERHGRIAISRYTTTMTAARTFAYDPLIRTATVRPPAPFSGTALFNRDAKPANRWTGNLTVDLPGHSNVRLTGSGFRASLVHARWDD